MFCHCVLCNAKELFYSMNLAFNFLNLSKGWHTSYITIKESKPMLIFRQKSFESPLSSTLMRVKLVLILDRCLIIFQSRLQENKFDCCCYADVRGTLLSLPGLTDWLPLAGCYNCLTFVITQISLFLIASKTISDLQHNNVRRPATGQEEAGGEHQTSAEEAGDRPVRVKDPPALR